MEDSPGGGVSRLQNPGVWLHHKPQPHSRALMLLLRNSVCSEAVLSLRNVVFALV